MSGGAIIDTLVDLGRSAFQRGDLPEAETLFRRAHAAGRNDAEILHFLGFIARTKDDLTDAGNFYAAALARAPTDAQLHNNLAEVRRAQKRDAEALALYRRAVALAPDQAEIQGNLGALLMALRRHEDALPHLLKALEMRPDLLALRNDTALALSALGRYHDTLTQYRAVISQQPANAGARYLEALALLAIGDFERGWCRHEARWYAELGENKRRVFEQPYWLGEDNLAGRTLLLHAEQGYGDTVQFMRYVPRVIAMAGSVILEVHKEMQPLLTGFPGIGGVFARGEELPPFDQQCSFMSLARAFRTTLATIPAAVPYLTVPEERLPLWRDRLGERQGRRRVAFAWSGSKGGPWNRDMTLSLLLPLLQRDDCEWHVAQIDVEDDDRGLLAETPNVVEHSEALQDFADTAALLSQMDMVISVDTALVHLAGALARPVWTMLPMGADYRWLMDRSDSPWYPTMRLFRQPRLKDWPAVVAAVAAALDALPDAALGFLWGMNEFAALMVRLALESAQAGQYVEAETIIKHSIGVDGDDEGYALYLLGHIQYNLRRYEEAAIALGQAVAIKPYHAWAQNDLAATLFALGRHDEAVSAIERALAAGPGLAEAQETWSIELLRAGKLREGWPHYEARHKSTAGIRLHRDFAQPQWRGELPIAGRTILLHAEQGAGDTFQFARYVPMVAALGATVLLEVQHGMRAAMTGLDGAAMVLEQGEALPVFDLHCPLLSLPLAFDTGLDTIPATVPYLAVSPERLAAWRARLGPRDAKRIGVVFSGSTWHPDDHRRSIPLVQFARLLASGEGREFHILQAEIREADRFALELLPDVREHTGMIADFADTAALIALMDVVVTVDTAVAHLAGALGWPVWVLLPFRPDWRWMMGRDDSPWYPTMWLFRQKRPGDWESVLDDVAQRLEEMLG